MATITLGIGCAHTPQLHTRPSDWAIRGDRDRNDGLELWYRGARYRYAELVELRRDHGYHDPAVLALDEGQRRLDRCFAAIDQLASILDDSDADVALICGNDQHELFAARTQPAFSIIGAATIGNGPRTAEQASRLPPGIALSDHGHLPPERVEIPGAPELATHLAESLARADVDVTFCAEVPEVEPDRSIITGMPHAFGFIYRNLMHDAPLPNVPLVVNTFFAPNRPSARRCYQYGVELSQAIGTWDSDAKVVVIASGGLSHFVIDEKFDRDLLAALGHGDLTRFLELDDAWYRTGTSECKNWILAAGILAGSGLAMETLEYQSLPRTEAGTGSTCAFTVWR